MAGTAPILSTPAEHIFEDPGLPTTAVIRLPEEQLHAQYEIERTVSEIRKGRWKKIALQFPDHMLGDAPRVFERLREELRLKRQEAHAAKNLPAAVDAIAASMADTSIQPGMSGTTASTTEPLETDTEEKLCILADTSYGACCVDEIAAEHVEADVIVHYGRTCLSPTARLPVIYVYTAPPLDVDAVTASFEATFPDKAEKIGLLADIPFHHHLAGLGQRLATKGYSQLFMTEVRRDPSSLLPNRTIPPEAEADPDKLREYSIFHVSTPPPSLLLTLTSRVKSIHIYPTDSSVPVTSAVESALSTALLRRRYALVTRLSTVPIFGILINTLSVSNYMQALSHVQSLIAQAGKKCYVFVVGKVNAAKLANFAEIGGWVVIGCWESSLIESKDFYKPIITPFELEVALTEDKARVWGAEWVSDFNALLRHTHVQKETPAQDEGSTEPVVSLASVQDRRNGDFDDEASDDEPPDFDLRTGRYVSHTRPMGRSQPSLGVNARTDVSEEPTSVPAQPSSALTKRSKGDLAVVNGAASPGAEYLRSKRTWQGLGSDFEVAYERDEHGKIIGAPMEEGRGGLAQGYQVGDDAPGRT